MKKILYGLMILGLVPALQGCFSHTKEIHEVRDVPSSTTTVVSPEAGGSSVTSTNP